MIMTMTMQEKQDTKPLLEWMGSDTEYGHTYMDGYFMYPIFFNEGLVRKARCVKKILIYHV